ncbi:MAG: LCP family protein [Niameybacter sp.]|uniref:LCP family protein n=1 Tax=Niameybacter sp. TaxID=2033640 RepID=UPI002FC775AE
MRKVSKTGKKQLMKFFLRTMLMSFVAVVLIGGIAACTMGSIFDKINVASRDQDPTLPKYDRNEDVDQEALHLNVAVFGVDKDQTRTDVIFVVHFNSETGKTEIVSVPRDTKVTWSDYQIQKAKELDRPVYNPCKITEMSAYGGIDNIRYFTVSALEDILGIKIDHYAVVNIDAFRKIVDGIGGVELDVPRRMKYTDRSQGLYIDLQPGLQVLNGEQAEGLVRWRHNDDYSEQYAEGDVGRIETQQLFLEAFAKKVMSPHVLKALPQMINILYSDIKTDVTLKEMPTYLGYINTFDINKIAFSTLPGEFVREEKWYYVMDYDQIDTFIGERFNEHVVAPVVLEE